MNTISKGQRDWLWAVKRFNFGNRKFPPKQFLVYCADGSFKSGGLADRFKGMVSCYAFCRVAGIPFKIFHTDPFELQQFLAPNTYKWTINPAKELTYHFAESRLLNLICENDVSRLKELNTTKQIHCFANTDLLRELNDEYNRDYEWSTLFRELFIPTPLLTRKLDDCKQAIGGSYIGVHFRFRNLLGDFKEDDSETMEPGQIESLMDLCKKALVQLQTQHPGQAVLVTSDSARFLEKVKPLVNVFVFDGDRVHIDFVESSEKDRLDFSKSFVDFFLLSEAQSVYSFCSPEMYPSQFPQYAAKLNGVPFKRFDIA